ncbi:MAG: protein kinase domain-containing protein [Planctomycetota bacterium]|jgi:serine/threonine-protein kinase
MSCSLERSNQFLRCELSEAEQARFEEHLESCESCRQSLELATSREIRSLQLRSRLYCSREMPTWTPFRSGTPESASASYQSELAILAPTDDPYSLGRISLFEIRSVIGRGGMGTVFKAIDPALGRTVAIKILRPDLATIGSARQRFALEARAMASVAHPRVVPIHAVDEYRGIPYMAMEYVPGGNLETRLKNEGPLPIVSVLRIAQQIASALSAAHDCGLVHRDIKPANILLDRGVDRVRVADFGLVRVTDDASMTRSGVIAGTPQYMSPEQVKGESCDQRSDFFALGAVMYALLVGHPPFRAESPYAAMQRIVHDTPRPIRQSRSDAPKWLEQLIEKLLAKDPAQRFSQASEVAEALEDELAFLQNPSYTASPSRAWMAGTTTTIDWLPKSLRTRWATATIALAFGAMMTAGIVAGVWNATSPRSASSENSSQKFRAQQTVSDVPLWATDGYPSIRSRVDALQAPPPNSDSGAADGWWQEYRNIESQLQVLEATDF